MEYMHVFYIIPQRFTPDFTSGPFEFDLSEITELQGKGVTRIEIVPIVAPGTLEDQDLTITAHGCAHPTTQPPSTTPPPPTTTPSESTTSPAHTTTPQSTTPEECYDEIGSVKPPSVTGQASYDILFPTAAHVNEISFVSNGRVLVVSILVEVFTGPTDDPLVRVSL